MFLDLAVPAAVLSLVLLFGGVPAVYRHEALGSSAGLLGFLLVLMWVLFRGYRVRVVGPHRPAHLLGYLLGFLIVDHAVNFYCFMCIESPVEFPWLSFEMGWFLRGVAMITVLMLKFMFYDWLIVGFALRVLDCRQAWSMAMRIVVYSLPASLLVALPGIESWKVAVAATVVVQAITLWRLKVEGALATRRSCTDLE